MFFARKNKEQSDFSEFVEQRTRLLYAKLMYALDREHMHFFSTLDIQQNKADARCKVCGILLTEYRIQERFEKMNSPVSLSEKKKRS